MSNDVKIMKKFSEDEIEEIKIQYRDLKPKQEHGDSIRVIADLHGCSRDDISNLVMTSHFPPPVPRHEFVPKKVTKPRRSAEQTMVLKNQIREMSLAGISDRTICETLHCSRSFVGQTRRKMGIESKLGPIDGGKTSRIKHRSLEKTHEKGVRRDEEDYYF